jgi:N-acetylneuraminic acid mutarotase
MRGTGRRGTAILAAVVLAASVLGGCAGGSGATVAPVPAPGWTPIAPMLQPRYLFGASAVNGRIYAAGGLGGTGGGQFANDVEVYNPLSNSWAVDGPFTSPRYSFGLAGIGNTLYAVGGETLAGGTVSTVEAYDTLSHTWAAKRSMNIARGSPGAAAINNVLYAVGGRELYVETKPTDKSNALEAYDPATDVWTSKAPMPTPRMTSAVAVVNNILYVIGGIGASGASLTTVEAYDPATNTWTTKAPMPTARHFMAAAVVNNSVYVIGGVHFTGPQGSDVLALVEAYDPAANTWTTMPPMPSPRYGLAAAVLGSVVYAMAGDFNGPVVNTVEAYTP